MKLDIMLADSLHVNEDILYRSRLLAGIVLVFAIVVLLDLVYLTFTLERKELINSYLLVGPVFLVYLFSIYLLKFQGAFELASNITVGGTALLILTSIALTGGPVLAPSTHVLVVPAVVMMCLRGLRVGILWACLISICFYGLQVLAYFGLDYSQILISQSTNKEAMVLMNWTISFTTILFVMGLYELVNQRLFRARKREKKRLEHMATHDVLTGLANRVLFEQVLKQSILRCQRKNLVGALIFIDLNGFKKINDNLGHEAGDKVLVAVSEFIDHAVRRPDAVARLGGDEFAVILDEIRSAEDADLVAQKISEAIQLPIILPTQEISITASLGISVFPRDGVDADQLLNRADERMYINKEIYYKRQLNA